MINNQRLLLSNIMICFLLCISLFPNFINSQLTTIIKYEYYSPYSNYSNKTEDTQTNGIVSSLGSQSIVPYGQAFLLVDSNGKYDGCQKPQNTLNYSNGIAIIQRGGDCTFSVKTTLAKQYGASAVIIYDPQNNGQDMVNMVQNNSDILSVYVQQSIGSLLFDLAKDNRTYLNITLEPINIEYDDSNREIVSYGSRSATIFIAIAISVLVCLCISWFIFYYCQRYRSRTAKDRLQNRLTNAAKKAINKISLVTITENPQIEESCVICLDIIKIGDTVRQLVCGHRFHHHCVDPWLVTHRHCPLCNLDILAAYRIPVPTANSRRLRSIVPENLIPSYHNSLATTAATSIINQNNLQHDEQQQTSINMQSQPIPSISGAIKDESINVYIHGEQNPSFRSNDNCS